MGHKFALNENTSAEFCRFNVETDVRERGQFVDCSCVLTHNTGTIGKATFTMVPSQNAEPETSNPAYLRDEFYDAVGSALVDSGYELLMAGRYGDFKKNYGRLYDGEFILADAIVDEVIAALDDEMDRIEGWQVMMRGTMHCV